MKRPQTHQVERTNYYSGMLLSEKDMLNEQLYMNGRRYLGNKFLHGTGVAGGLTVVKVDEEMLSLEIGFAIDSCGREIIVDRPRLMRFSQIRGYEEFMALDDCTKAYLCIRYAEEKLTEEDICLTDAGDEEQHCKRIREGYDVYLTQKPLGNVSNTLEYFRGQETILYRDDDITVFQRIPNFLEAGKEFETQIYIVSRLEEARVEVHICEGLSCVNYQDGETFKADISATMKEKYKFAEYPYTLKAYNIEDGTAEMRISLDHSYIVVNGEKKELASDICLQASVTGNNEFTELVRRYYIDYFEKELSDTAPVDIYLAAIDIDRIDGGYRILNIENMPFGQYIPSAFLQMGFTDRVLNELKMLGKELRKEEVIDNSQNLAVSRKPKISSGEYVFKIALGAKQDQRLISEEIVHGLGLGPITVDVSLIEDLNQLHGAAGIFDEMELKIDTAVLTDMSKGSFRIGIRVREVTALPEIKIHWTAMMNPAEKADDDRQKRIRIIPDKLEMKTLQNYYLKAEADNLTGAVILWEVNTPNGGVISRDGLYTAPDIPGVYEVSAFCQESPEIKDSIFIIVRE